MKRILTYFGIAGTIFISTPHALAQRATELYIPIGKSPGISGVCSMTGTIDSVYTAEHILKMSTSSGESYEVNVTDETKIYLDKSFLKQTNKIGTYSDCKVGAYCEVLYESHSRKDYGEAEWIKIRVIGNMEK
jgi:hypothetical protein